MNRNDSRNRWQQVKGSMLRYCGFLSDEQLDRIAGRRAELLERIQQTSGMALEQARLEREAIERSLLLHAAPTLVGQQDDEIRHDRSGAPKRKR